MPARSLYGRRWEKGEKRIGNGVWLLLRDPMARILDVDSSDVGCDFPEVIADDRSEAAGTADAEHGHGQLVPGKVLVRDNVGRESPVIFEARAERARHAVGASVGLLRLIGEGARVDRPAVVKPG
jgi:hypothetical protein